MIVVRQVVVEFVAVFAAVARGVARAVRGLAEAVEGLFWLAAVLGVLYLALVVAVRQGAAPGLAPLLAGIDAHAAAVAAWVGHLYHAVHPVHQRKG